MKKFISLLFSLACICLIVSCSTNAEPEVKEVVKAEVVTETETVTETVYVQVDYNRPTYESIEVGDVILNDGTIIPYLKGYGFTSEQRANAIGVVIFSNHEKALCVGIKSKVTYWSYPYYDFYNQYFETVLTKKDGSPFAQGNYLPNGKISDIGSYSGYTCGSNSYALISANSLYFDSTFPAISWINSYGRNNNITGLYANNWYMPALQELLYINENYDRISSVLSALGTIIFTEAWSSSVYSDYPYGVDFSNKEVFCLTSGKDKVSNAIAVHNVILQ